LVILKLCFFCLSFTQPVNCIVREAADFACHHCFETDECFLCFSAKEVEQPAEEKDEASLQLSPTPGQVPLTAAEAFINHQVQVAEAKQQIASLSMAIISSPEDNVMIWSWFVKCN